MRKNTLLGLALATAMAVSTLAIAAPSGHGEAGHRGHHGDRHGQMMMLHKLDLSDAQRARIKQIISSNREQNKAPRQALQKQRRAFEAMTPDQAGYQAAAAGLAQAAGQEAQARVQQMAHLRAQIYAVLTPAQRAQAVTLQAQAQARRQQWQQFKAQHPRPSAQ